MAFTTSSKLIAFALSCFISKQDNLSFLAAKNQVVSQYKLYNAERDLGLKSTSFEISDNGFIRYKKTTIDNKSEFFSVKANELQDITYLGNENAGWLLLKFTNEAVIYQTYNDKSGNTDEMRSEIKIPLKHINVNEINSLVGGVNSLKQESIKLTTH